MINYKVGDKIVAIRDSEKGAYKKGDEFICQELTHCPCCFEAYVDIGTRRDFKGSLCKCNYIIKLSRVWYAYAKNFTKLDPIEQSIKQLLKETLTENATTDY